MYKNVLKKIWREMPIPEVFIKYQRCVTSHGSYTILQPIFCSRNLIFSPQINNISIKWISHCLINHMSKNNQFLKRQTSLLLWECHGGHSAVTQKMLSETKLSRSSIIHQSQWQKHFYLITTTGKMFFVRKNRSLHSRNAVCGCIIYKSVSVQLAK
jgi:hypothetical protein